MSDDRKIAIIGAGLSGLTLSLALHKSGFKSVIYETRKESLNIGGAIMLSPNALRIMDTLGVYERMVKLGFQFETLHFIDSDEKFVDDYAFGSKEKFGYQALRIYRTELINTLLDMVSEAGIEIVYDKKFTKIVKEDETQVTWEFADGTTGSAPLLIGADGIHSTVRKYLYPDLTPKFTHMIGITCAVPRSQIEAPDYPMPVTITNPKHPAFVMAPQLVDGSEIFCGKPMRFPTEPDRQGWADLYANKQWCVEFLQADNEGFPDIVRRATSKINKDRINIWPFYVVPKLDTWVSNAPGRVIILGDAAHAIPPTAGQGINQAFEDLYTLVQVLKHVRDNSAENRAELLKKWQNGRQARIDKILELNANIDKRRLPDSDGDIPEGAFNNDWLYNADFDSMVKGWIDGN